MKVCCFGSMNIDMVFDMEDFVRPKETVHSKDMKLYAGGKGFNQAISLNKAGVQVYMAGSIGRDGNLILDKARENDLNMENVRILDGKTGIAVIQVDRTGENCIILYNASNMENDRTYIDRVLDKFCQGDYLVLQNEINNLSYLIEEGHRRGMTIFLNPSPIDKDLLSMPLELCHYLLVNEVEGEALSGQVDYGEIVLELRNKYGNNIVLTVGDRGVYYNIESRICHQPAHKVEVVDTTGAGDAFTGYFIASLAEGKPVDEAIRVANKVASMVVGQKGASDSIPRREDLHI